MNTKIFAGVGLAVLIAMVAAAIVITNPLSTEAAKDRPHLSSSQAEVLPHVDVVGVEQTTQPDSMGQLQAAPDSDTESKPYIGVAIYPLPDGTVKVAKVLEGGPSDGVLEDGDIITAINGETIDGAKDLTDAIADAGVGASLTLTVTRGGSDMDVSVTVGEWEEKKRERGGKFHKVRRHERPLRQQPDSNGRRRRELPHLPNRGRRHNRAGRGRGNIHPPAEGRFRRYRVHRQRSDTRVFVGKDEADDLSGLDTGEEVVVMDVDGEVKVVKRTDDDAAGGFGYRKGRMYKFGPRRRAPPLILPASRPRFDTYRDKAARKRRLILVRKLVYSGKPGVAQGS